MESQRQKCIRCKMNMTMDKFKQKRDDSYQKTCNVCLDMRNKKNECEHGRRRNQRKDCGGSSICEHNKHRSKCKDCGGSSICEHDKERSKCIDCGGASICEHNILERNKCKLCSDPLKITIKTTISGSKCSDKKHDRCDIVNFVDYAFIENLLDDYSHCCYPDCNAELQIVHYQDDLATIERLDDSIGHIKSNCVICCLKCNLMKKSVYQ